MMKLVKLGRIFFIILFLHSSRIQLAFAQMPPPTPAEAELLFLVYVLLIIAILNFGINIYLLRFIKKNISRKLPQKKINNSSP